MMSHNALHLGNHALGKKPQPVFLTEEARRAHMHIIGGSGVGKSKLLEYMIRQDIQGGKGLCLIDPHGNLFDSILEFMVRYGFDKRLIVINPAESEWSVGLNYLEHDKFIFDPGHHAENVIKGIGKAREEDIFKTAGLVHWLRHLLQLLISSGLTLMEAQLVMKINNQALRQKLLEGIVDPQLRTLLKEAWHQFETTTDRLRDEHIIFPVLNRINTFLSTQTMRRIIGQAESRVNFYDAMQSGMVVLVNLSQGLTDNEKNLLGIQIIDKIYQAGAQRKPETGKQFYVYIDEFGRFVSHQLALGLEELRKRRVSFILAHQELEQLRDAERVGGDRLLAAVNTNTKVKVAFRISRHDAEEMALEVFAGKIDGSEIKHQELRTTIIPHKSRETVYAKGGSEAESQSESTLDSISQISNQLSGMVYVPDQGWLSSDYAVSMSQSTSSGLSEGRGSGRASGKSRARSEVEIDVPFYDLEVTKEVAGTTFYSIEEIKERFTQMLQNQDERYFHLRILGKSHSPIPLITETVKPSPVLPSQMRKALEENYRRYCLPAHEVDLQIEMRRQALLASNEVIESERALPDVFGE